MSRGELDRQEAARGDTFRPGWDGGGLVGEVGQDRPGGAWTGLWLPSESLPWELGGVGGICRDSRPETQQGGISLLLLLACLTSFNSLISFIISFYNVVFNMSSIKRLPLSFCNMILVV